MNRKGCESMSVNSPVAGLREPTLVRAVSGASVAHAPARARRARHAAGAHRDPAGTFWRTTMDEVVYFMTMGTVRPWRRRRRAPVRE